MSGQQAAKKEEERRHVQTVLDHLGLKPLAVESPDADPPDVKVTFAHKTVGVEVTDYQRDLVRAANRGLRDEEATLEEIREASCAAWEADGPLEVAGRVAFGFSGVPVGMASADSYLLLPRRSEHREFIRQLRQFAENQCSELEGDEWKVFGPPFGASLLDEFVRHIELRRFDGYDWDLNSGKASTFGLSEENWVHHVKRKARRIQAAGHRVTAFDETWLLVVGGLDTRGSQLMAVTPRFFEESHELNRALQASPFRRFVVWENLHPGRLWTWTRGKGWARREIK